MRRVALRKTLSCLALAAGFWLAGEHSAGAVTLNNAGFELYDGTSNVASNWVAVAPAGATGDFQVVSTPVYEGVRAQQFAFSGLTNDQTASIEQTFAIDPGAEYELSGYFKVDTLSNAKIHFKVEYFDAANNLVDSNVTEETPRNLSSDENSIVLPPSYFRLQNIKHAKTNAVSCRVSVNLIASADGGTGTFTVDNFALRKTSQNIFNAGFETYNGIHGVADSWRSGTSKKTPFNFQVANAPATGTRAQKVSASNMPFWGYAQVNQMVAVQQDALYTVVGKVKVEAIQNAKVQMYVDYFDADYNPLGSDSGEMEQSTVTNGYVELKNETTAPEHAAFLKVWVLLRSTADNGSGTFYVDDVNVMSSIDYPPDQPIIDLIPKMTSNTAPQGEVLVSANYYSKDAWRLFDSTSTSVGADFFYTATTGVFGYDFKTPAVVREYIIQPFDRLNLNKAPSTWTFEGFDGTNWNVLDTRTNVTDWAEYTNKSYTISNRRAYWMYRLNVTANNGDPNSIRLNEVYMNGYFAKPVTPKNLLNTSNGDQTVSLSWSPVIGVTSYNVYAGDTLVKTVPANTTTATITGLTNDTVYHFTVTGVNGSGESLRSEEVLAMPYNNDQWLTSKMLSNTSPFGQVTVSGSGTSTPTSAYTMFDRSITYGMTLSTPTAAIDYDFKTPTLVKEYTIDASNYPASTPKSWTFEGFDGTQWVELDRRSNITSWKAYERKFYTMSNTEVFSKYRLNILASNGSTSLSINEIELVGDYQVPSAPKGLTNSSSGDGTVSLEWSGIAGATSYGIYQNGVKVQTVPAVLTTNLQKATLTGLTNGYTIAFEVTAILTSNGVELESERTEPHVLAMPFGSADWANPKMVSNTSPSGVAWASSALYDAYKLFDHSFSYWSGSSGSAEITYEFAEPTAVMQYTINPLYALKAPRNWTFEAYNGTSWVVLDTKSGVSNWVNEKAKFFTIGNYNSYRKYRLNITAKPGDPTDLQLIEIQLIGN